MKICKAGHRALLAAAGFQVVPVGAQAIQASDVLAYSFGPLVLRPHLELTEKYDSNIFYRPNNETSDFISTISPGLTLYLVKP